MNRRSEVFKALSEETRLRILNLMLRASEALCVCEMVDTLRAPQYQVSKHLVILRHAGLVDYEKRGTWAYYSLNTQEPENRALFAFLKTYLIGGAFQEDAKALQVRLFIREQGKCVVGFVPEKDLRKRILAKKRRRKTASFLAIGG